MNESKIIFYAGLVLPFLYGAAPQPTVTTSTLTSLDWVVRVVLGLWFCVGVLVLAGDIEMLWKSRKAVRTQEENDYVVEEDAYAEARNENDYVSTHAVRVPHALLHARTFTTEDDIISHTGNPTIELATDSTLPWPAPWDIKVLERLKAHGIAHDYIPLYVGVTRWKASGEALQGQQIAPLAHKIYPGSQMSVLVAGSTDSGKSVLLNTMLISAAYTTTPDQLQFWIVELDANGANFQTVAALPHCKGVVTDRSQAFALALRIDREHKRRSGLFVEASQQGGVQIDDIGAYNKWAVEKEQPPLPILIVVIDELKTFRDSCKGTAKGTDFGKEFVERMSYAMRKTGIGPIFATQYPLASVLPREASTQMSTVISMRLNDSIQRRVVFGDGAIPFYPEHLPAIDPDPRNKKYAGRCVIHMNGRYYLGQTASIPEKEQIVAAIMAPYAPVADEIVETSLFVE